MSAFIVNHSLLQTLIQLLDYMLQDLESIFTDNLPVFKNEIKLVLRLSKQTDKWVTKNPLVYRVLFVNIIGFTQRFPDKIKELIHILGEQSLEIQEQGKLNENEYMRFQNTLYDCFQLFDDFKKINELGMNPYFQMEEIEYKDKTKGTEELLYLPYV
jgi:hypothetical protein